MRTFFITAFENRSVADAFVWRVLNAVEAGLIAAATSQMTLAEVLPKPLVTGRLIQVYESLLSTQGALEVLPVTAEILGDAARIRADRLSIKFPDAIHIATARRSGCNVIYSADKRVASPLGLPVVQPVPSSLEQLQAFTA